MTDTCPTNCDCARYKPTPATQRDAAYEREAILRNKLREIQHAARQALAVSP